MCDCVRLDAERVICSFSSEHPPALAVDSGATLAVEVRDAYDRHFQREPDLAKFLRDRDGLLLNPATGPIYIQGSEPGEGLDVTIEKIELAETGYVAAVPGIGVLGDTEIEPRLARFDVRPDGLYYEGRLRLPLRPMVGTIGVAPAGAAIPSLQIGHHGGNLDCNDITEGATVHFPVSVEGALLAVGDVHANMGAAEVHSGVNIDATVTLTVNRVEGASWERPWFETASEVMTLGVHDAIDGAIREATAGMTELLRARLGVSHTEAIILAGASCDIRLGQASKFGTKVSAYAVIPKSVFA